MPAAQVIDLTPTPRNETTLEKTVGSFVDKYRQNQIEENEYNALESIYKRHQHDGNNLQNMIQDVISDPRLSPTKRVTAVQSLTEAAKFNAKLQEETYKQGQAAEKARRDKAILDDLAKRRGLEPGSLDAYVGNVALAESVTRPDKPGKKTQASQPIDEDQLKRIQHVENQPEYKNASLPVKKKMLRDSGVSKENADSVIDAFTEEEKNKPGSEYNKLREKAVADYVTSSLQKRGDAEELQFTLDSAKKAIEGEIEGPGVKALIKNDPYGQLFVGLTPDEASLQASNKKLLEGSKGVFGSKPTEREIFLLLNSMLPAIGKSKEANLASLYFIDKLNKLKIMHGDLVEEISKEGYVPDIESQVNQRMKPMIEEFRKELNEGVQALEETEKIKVKSPEGQVGYMTRKQIQEAKNANYIFTPI